MPLTADLHGAITNCCHRQRLPGSYAELIIEALAKAGPSRCRHRPGSRRRRTTSSAFADLQPGLFTGIDWSTEHVLKQTIERCKALHLTYVMLTELRDIDRIEDLAYYREQGMLL